MPLGRELTGRNLQTVCKGRTSQCCQLGKDKDVAAGWEEEWVWLRDGGRDGW